MRLTKGAATLQPGLLLFFMFLPAYAQKTRTIVAGTVFTSSGVPARGTIAVSWPAFHPANGDSVPAGSRTIQVAPDGTVIIDLVPNISQPDLGVDYTVTYHLDGEPDTIAYWRVPSLDRASIVDVEVRDGRSLSSPSVQYLPLTGGSLLGPLQLYGDPVSPLQAATKNYVDTSVATALPLVGGVVSGTLGAGNLMAKLPRVDVRSSDFAGGADPTGAQDSFAAITAAIAFAQSSVPAGGSTFPTIYLPPGRYKVSGSIRLPNNMHLVGDSKANTILQETGASTNLITIFQAHSCSVYTCYGGVEGMTLAGSGKATTGILLETDTGGLILRDLNFFNNGGRGLQMNGPSERIVGHNLSFYDVRWPMVLAGDTNEDYFYNTHVIEAGQTRDLSGSSSWFTQWCYSVNCVNGAFNAPGTSSSPTILLPDPHGSVHIDKAVNVTFIGGSIKSTAVMSGVRVWNGDLVKFENMYHEDVYGGNVPRTNRAYILGGKAEQTYLTGVLTGSGMSAAVHDPSWMPQYYGNPADVTASAGDYYGYVILPQDYNRGSTAPSAYVSGVQQNQYEVVTVNGFASDGNVYIGGRNLGASTAPAGTQWPAGSVIEQYSGLFGFSGPVEFDNIHLNQVQGPLAAGGYQVGCNQLTANFCGEIVAGYAPDPQALSSDMTANQIGFYAPLGDPGDPVPGAQVQMNLRSMDMGNNASNPYVGQIATHHRATIQIYGGAAPEAAESTAAVSGTATSKQMSLASATGGSYVTAPVYSTGMVAGVVVTMPNAGTLWDPTRGIMTKNSAVFGRYMQYGTYMSGLQYQNLYCLFDSPPVDGGHPLNRFCAGGGPSNTSAGGPGYGPGVEYDSWNGSSWVSIFQASGNNGTGAVTSAPITSVSLTSTSTVSGTKMLFSGSGSSLSNAPILAWSPYGACSTQNLGCTESGAPLPLVYPVTLRSWTATLATPPAGCSNAGVLTLFNGSAALSSMTLTNSTSTYVGTISAPLLASNAALQIKVSSAAVGCSTYGSGINSNVTYSMQ